MEVEQISVDHVAHIKPSDGSSAATQVTSYHFLANILSKLNIEKTLLDCSAKIIKLLIV